MKKRLAAILGIVISGIYLLNFTLGIFELPDNLPFVGHLDEFGASVLLIASLKHFGIDFTNFLSVRKKSRKENKEQDEK